uniref:tRNA (guanine(37)-N1)-methyltransferase n=1 Tax=Scleropages formosus TaxID=113540 RepID=A0A8C9W066_SCLFO
ILFDLLSLTAPRRVNPRTLCQSLCGALKAPVIAAHRATMSDPEGGGESSLYTPPPEVRGMISLDREAFSRTVTVPALRVQKEVLGKLVKSLKKVALHLPGVKRVLEDDDKHRLLLLDPTRVSSPSSFGETETQALEKLGVPLELHSHELRLTYGNLKADEVLRAVLPEGQDVTSGFSRVGHVAHLNLREHQLPYKNLIGQVIMDKNSGVTCVVNKTNTIDSTFRTFQMEVLAGDGNMVVKVRENGLPYEFDFSRVYWNPRLSTEHERVVGLLQPGDTVMDVFAGVGPFAIPAAKRGCNVLANDLNPESHRWLSHNCRLNKVEHRLRVFNMDGRAFIRGPLREALPALMKGTAGIHIVMNLPALALEFLDAFQGLLGQEPDQNQSVSILPEVHCYGFSKEGDPSRDIVERASRSLGISLDGHCSIHMVRNVAPNKEMMCISFSLSKDVLFSNVIEDTPEEPAPKRQKCEEPE